jgi:hypothetical protein
VPSGAGPLASRLIEIAMPATDNGYAHYRAMIDRRTALAEALRPANKVALFEPLTLSNVATVNVTFDGAGDSGQIEAIEYLGADGWPLEPNEFFVSLATPSEDGLTAEHNVHNLRDAVEAFVYDCLEQTHAGWEIDAGAYGTFKFDVAAGTIRLDFHERFEASEHHGHDL